MWHFLFYISDGISYMNRNSLNIRFVEITLEEDSKDEKELCKNVKQMMEIIVGLLREKRVDIENELKNKKVRDLGSKNTLEKIIIALFCNHILT